MAPGLRRCTCAMNSKQGNNEGDKLVEEPRRPDPKRMAALPLEVKQMLTKDEVDAFLFSDEWPDSLLTKLHDYLVEEE